MLRKFNIGSFGTDRLWKRIAMIAGVFAVLICILLIANYVQVKKADPVNMQVINTLVNRLYENPSDSLLREEVRTLDLLSRKAYFTTKWQIRTGGYALLLAIAVIVIAFQIISYRAKISPQVSKENVDYNVAYRKKARVFIVAGGGVLLVTAVVFAVLSTNRLLDRFNKLSNIATEDTIAESSGAGGVSAVAGESDSVSVSLQPSDTSLIRENATVAVTDQVKASDNYPTFRGPGGYGIARQKNLPVSWDGATGANILWKAEVPLQGHSSPVIWGDRIFVTGASTTKKEVYCFDRNSGKLLWTTSIPDKSGSPVPAPNVSAETGYAAPTAATDGTNVYAIFATGEIMAVDMNGKIVWTLNLGVPGNHYGHSSSLQLYKDLVIVQYDQKTSPKLMALSAKTGKTVWSTIRPVKVSWSSPIVVNTGKRTEIMLVAEPYVASYNPDNGQELWKVDCITGEVGTSLAYANGMVFSVNEYSQLAAIRLGNQPSVVWNSTDYLSDIPSPVATDKYLFLATSWGLLVCYDAATGEKYWEAEIGNSIQASPVVADNKVYLLDREGIMHVIKVDKQLSEIGKSALGEKASATPAFTNGKIYIRGDYNLYCIGK